MEVFNIQVAKQWFTLIEDGLPEDIALSRLKEEATASGAHEYSGSLEENGFCPEKLKSLTEAELLAIKMYCTESFRFYLLFNEDCRNRKWKNYVVYTCLMHSVCMKLRNKPIEREDFLYRGLRCESREPKDANFCWPCFTSATTQRGIAESFGMTITELESRTGAPVKQFSSYFEYEILFSPFQVFKCRTEGDRRIYSNIPEQSMFFLSFPHYRGALLGAVVANCLGSPYEYKPPTTLNSLPELFDKLGEWKKGSLWYTSDTSMTMALAKSLTETNGLDVKKLKASFVTEYVNNPARGYGDSVVSVLLHLQAQGPADDPFAPARQQFGGSGSYGNGGAMRIAPAALFFFKEKENEFNEKVKQITQLTHYNTSAVNGAILQANAVKLALQLAFEGDWDEDIREQFIDGLQSVMTRLQNSIGSNTAEYYDKLEKMKGFIENPPEVETVREKLGNGMSAVDSVPTAIYCFIRSLEPISKTWSKLNAFERTIMYAISLGGDTDTIASMAGAIAGAYYGQDAVTQRSRDVCEPKAIEDAKRYSKLLHGLVFN